VIHRGCHCRQRLGLHNRDDIAPRLKAFWTIKMKIKLHIEAAKALDAIADAIVPTVSELPSVNPELAPHWGQQHISHNFTDADLIGAPRAFTMDGSGNIIGVSTAVDNRRVEIVGENYERVRDLVRRAASSSALKNALSEEYIEKAATDWCVAKVAGETSSFSDFLISKATADVAYQHLWVPIAFLSVQEDFQFGPCKIITIPRSLFDDMEQEAVKNSPENREDIVAGFTKFRNELQGNAAVTVSLKAESSFAMKEALHLAEDVVGLLRFFHISAFTAKQFCPTALLGSEVLPETTVLAITGINRFQYRKSAVHLNARPWNMSRPELADMKGRNLDTVAGLVAGDGLSEFATRVRSAVLTYSKGMTFADASDRLVYSLSALESLFLKDGSEPIQQNLGERIAFITSKDAIERMGTVKTVKAVYGARSQYIHHRKVSEALEQDINAFYLAAWAGLNSAIANLSNYKTTAEFLSAIDLMKFT
jgi:hypothetical protein